uniref:Uncharacterized protein n=1 Tax=Cannabis sativa TaxID=3483 RepID=A0A803P378_CANSA
MESRLAKNSVDNLRVKFHFDSGLEVPRIGRSGGLILLWTNDERIDWGIVNNSWIDIFLDALLTHLGFFGSDHRALELITSSSHVTNTGVVNIRFLFENVWLSDSNWARIFEKSWINLASHQAAIPSLIATQEACANSLSTWNHKKDFHFEKRINRLEKDLELARSCPNWDDRTIGKIKDLQSRLEALLYKEETYRKQRARTQWLA